MTVTGAQGTITKAVTAWEGVTAQAHHILPESGWVSFYVRQPEDVGQAIDLLAESYQIARKQKSGSLEVKNEN
jgi:hypothetical protein